MIRAWRGNRRHQAGTAWGIAAALLLGLVLAARPADPVRADPPLQAARQGALANRAEAARDALLALEGALQPARDAAREGAALVVDGDQAPEPSLERAADLLVGAGDEAGRAVQALDRLRGTAASLSAGIAIPTVPASAELASIAGQLSEAAEAAGPFVERRLTARRTLELLEDALAALDANDPKGARPALEDARCALDEVAAWDPAPVTLPLWLQTTERLISAAQGIAEAALAGDEEAAEAAAAEYAAAAEDARRADISLALSLSEAGSALTSTPLRRLADALAAVDAADGVVASLVQPAS
jgi:hypothetical protein